MINRNQAHILGLYKEFPQHCVHKQQKIISYPDSCLNVLCKQQKKNFLIRLEGPYTSDQELTFNYEFCFYIKTMKNYFFCQIDHDVQFFIWKWNRRKLKLCQFLQTDDTEVFPYFFIINVCRLIFKYCIFIYRKFN